MSIRFSDVVRATDFVPEKFDPSTRDGIVEMAPGLVATLGYAANEYGR